MIVENDMEDKKSENKCSLGKFVIARCLHKHCKNFSSFMQQKAAQKRG